MDKTLSRLSEARIREFQERARKAGLRTAATAPRQPREAGPSVEPLEVQLLKRINDLEQQASTASPKERAALLRQAQNLEIQLLTLLESTGRPIAAQSIAQRRQKK